MKEPHPLLYEQFYESILTAIYNGDLKKGEILMPIPQLANRYGVAVNTVKAGLDMLRKDGYIRSVKRKGTEVVCDAVPERVKRKLQRERCAEAAEILQMMGELVPDIAVFGLLNDGTAVLQKAEEVVWQAEQEHTPQQLFQIWDAFIRCFLQGAGNKRFCDLFHQAGRFACFPLTLPVGWNGNTEFAWASMHNKLQELLSLAKQGKTAELRGVFSEIFRTGAAVLEKNIPQAGCEKKKTFYWIQSKTGTLRYTNIADDILLKIVIGDYPYQTYLPAQSVLMEEYQASANSLRCALNILKEMGMVRYVKGKGYLIEDAAPEKPVLQELNHGYVKYMEYLQIIILTIDRVARSAFAHVTTQDAALFFQRKKQLLGTQAGYFYFPPRLATNLMFRAVPQKTTRNIYLEMERGMAFASRRLDYPDGRYLSMMEQVHESSLKAMACVGGDDVDTFAWHMKNMARLCFIAARDFAAENGIPVDLQIPEA